MKVLDLFSGSGAFSLGLEKAGMKTIAFCEKDKTCRNLLKKHWPGVVCYDDVRKTNEIADGVAISDIICGGDPCPIRSRARSNGDSRHPDLSGFFLMLVERKRPRWVLRENVPAQDDKAFAAAMEFLGYRTAIIRADAATFTGQSRQRDFIIGCRQENRKIFEHFLYQFESGAGNYTTSLGTREVIPALTTHRTRYDSRDCYIWEGRLRILDAEERTIFAGFPEGWFAGLSESACARIIGNSVVPLFPEIIGRAILEAENATQEADTT